VRQQTKPAIPEKVRSQNSPEIQPETKYSSRGTNRNKERRDAVLRKERLRALEKEIEELENMQKEIESSFSKDTRPEEYAEYATNAEKLSSVYDEYINLSEDDEE